MNYWLLALRRNKMDYCIDKRVFGLNRKYILGRVQIGDPVVCYVTGEHKIVAIGEMTSEHYLDDEPIFADEKIFGTALFADRVNFKADRLGTQNEIEFFDIIDQMSFIKNLAHWQVVFRSAITQMAKTDWNVICKSAASKQVSS